MSDAVPDRMRALLVTADESLELAEVPPPVLGDDEVLVRVAAAGVNRADLLQRAGRYRQPALARVGARTVAGMEVAGTVVARGAGVEQPTLGARVMAMCGGAYAQYAAVDAALALDVPADVADADAAALPVALMTSYDALMRAGRLQADETVLVTAAASAVGLVALQVAGELGAGTVLGSSRSDAGRAAIANVGGTPLDAEPDRLCDAASQATDSQGLDVVLDHVGGRTMSALLAAMRPRGRIVSVGRLGGREATLDLNELARLRLSLVGTTFRTRDLAEYREIAAGARAALLPAVAAGRITACTAESFPLVDADRALNVVAAGRAPGKVVLLAG